MSRQNPLPLRRLKSASEDIDHTNDRADDHTDDLKAHIKPIKKIKSIKEFAIIKATDSYMGLLKET